MIFSFPTLPACSAGLRYLAVSFGPASPLRIKQAVWVDDFRNHIYGITSAEFHQNAEQLYAAPRAILTRGSCALWQQTACHAIPITRFARFAPRGSRARPWSWRPDGLPGFPPGRRP